MKIFLKKGSGFVKISITCVFLCYKMIVFFFRDTKRSDHFLFFQNSWVVHYYSVICKVYYGWYLGCVDVDKNPLCLRSSNHPTKSNQILADTAILANTSKKEPLCSCYKHTSWMGWLLKKEGFVCQENLSTCNNSWRTVLSFRLPLSLWCVFDNKLTPFISGNGFGCSVI